MMPLTLWQKITDVIVVLTILALDIAALVIGIGWLVN